MASPQLSSLETKNNIFLRWIWSLPHTGILHCVAQVDSMYNTILHRTLKLLTVAMDSPSQVVREVFTLCKIASVRALSETSDFHLNSRLFYVHFSNVRSIINYTNVLLHPFVVCSSYQKKNKKKQQKKTEGQGVDYNTHIRAFSAYVYVQ